MIPSDTAAVVVLRIVHAERIDGGLHCVGVVSLAVPGGAEILDTQHRWLGWGARPQQQCMLLAACCCCVLCSSVVTVGDGLGLIAEPASAPSNKRYILRGLSAMEVGSQRRETSH